MSAGSNTQGSGGAGTGSGSGSSSGAGTGTGNGGAGSGPGRDHHPHRSGNAHTPMTTPRHTVALATVQGLTLAAVALLGLALPCAAGSSDDSPDMWWRDATTAERATHAVDQARALQAALDQARS